MHAVIRAQQQSRNRLQILVGAIIVFASISALYSLLDSTVSAATPPDSCFAFNAGTGTITDYYDHEANNPANPACTRDVDIPSTIGGVSVTSIGFAAMFEKQLTGVNIPNSVTSIDSYAFSDNQLTTVTLGSSVTTIGNSAFYYNQLTSVTIPNSVISIGNNAFASNQLTNVTIANAGASMQHASFLNNPVVSMTIGATTYIEQSPTTESACFAMSGNTIIDYYQASPVVALGSGVLCGRNVTIPNSVTSIGNNAFSDSQLTSVTIPAGVTSIGGDAFSNNQLTSVTIPNSVTSIGFWAFMYNQLTSVTIPNSVTSIGFAAFAIQSQWGGHLNNGTNGAPYLWSDDPAEVQEAYNALWYVRLYTEDPSNPNGLTNSILSEDWWWGDDGNANGLDDSFGGHFINPASINLQYVDQNDASLQTTQTFTGQLPDNNYLSSYNVSQGPTIPMPVSAGAPTPTEQAAIDDALSAYYRLGDSVTITPPTIPGYITPPTQTYVLGASDNEFSYVYSTEDSGTGTPTTPGGADADADADVAEDTDGSLAETGMNLGLIATISSLMIILGASYIICNRGQKGIKL